MGAHDNGFTCITLLDQQVLDQLCVDGIKRRKRLINDDNLGVVNQGGDELPLLLHTFTEFLGFLFCMFGQIEFSQVFG